MLDLNKTKQNISAVLPHKRRAGSIHALFRNRYPVGVGVENVLYVFAEGAQQYAFQREVRLPVSVPRGAEAAFPIAELDDCCCVVTPGCFAKPHYYVSILHEMTHCYQNRTCEARLRAGLDVHRQAMRNNDAMWEINYPFPYGSDAYRALVRGAADCGYEEMIGAFRGLPPALSVQDREYLVWQMWKEGFARYIENRIRGADGLPENQAGREAETPDRTSLYYIGDLLWRRLAERDGECIKDIETAFAHMKSECGLRPDGQNRTARQ